MASASNSSFQTPKHGKGKGKAREELEDKDEEQDDVSPFITTGR